MVLGEVSNGNWQQVLPNLLWFVLLFVVFYFLLIRPEQRRQKKLKKIQDDLKIGQKVYAGAIVGVVKKINEKTCVIHTANSEVEVLKLAIAHVEHQEDQNIQPIA